MRVYVDLAFAVNAVIDYLLLVCSARLSGAAIRRGRLLLAAALGGGFAAGSFFWAFLQYWPVGLAVAAGMILVAFGARRSSLRQGVLFVLVSLALAGLVLLVAAVFDWGLVLLHGAVYYPVCWQALLLVADSIGLGIFSVHGAAVAVRAGLGGNVFLTLLVGMLTGVGGGVLRDLCCMERPYIFTKHIYACASLAGAAACMLLWSAGENLALLTGCALTVVLRLCAAVFRWSLPKA